MFVKFKMFLILLQYLFLAQGIIALYVGDDCEPNENLSEGICTEIYNCEVAMSSIASKKFHSLQRCGFKGLNEVVCCPRTANKFGPSSEQESHTQRIADRECEKIVSSNLSPLDFHIIGGEMASRGEFPHMVALGYKQGEDSFEFNCGGSLVSNTYVLTAAHCIDTLERIRPTMVRTGVVELGDSRWHENSDVWIAEIIKHPEYRNKARYHDLALIRLQKSIQFSSSSVNAACLYTNSTDPTIPLTVTGWGAVSTTKDARSNTLLKANVTMVSRNICGESYKEYRKLPRGITEEQLCAGDPNGLRDTCQGDSGGPLQVATSSDGQYRLVGVTSLGRGCATKNPGVYTRIYQYLDWIENIVWKS